MLGVGEVAAAASFSSGVTSGMVQALHTVPGKMVCQTLIILLLATHRRKGRTVRFHRDMLRIQPSGSDSENLIYATV